MRGEAPTVDEVRAAEMARDAAVLAENLAYVRARATGAVEGVFGPASMAWRVYRESALLLGGMRALLLQIAHPAVAAGVAQYSEFRRNPFRRAFRTFDLTYKLMFGDLASAIATAEQIHARHHPVRGVIDGKPYRANDPELLLWVQATLLDTSIGTFELLVRPLRVDEKRRLYHENRLAAALFGIPTTVFPPTLEEFQAYFRAMLDGPELRVGETGRELGRALLAPPTVVRAASTPIRVLTPGLLPERLRAPFGIRFDEDERRRHERRVQIVRTAVAGAPSVVRYVPGYHQAHARIAEARGEPTPVEARLLRLVRRAVELPLCV